MSDKDGDGKAMYGIEKSLPVVGACAKAPRGAANAHIAGRHVGKGLGDLADRINPIGGHHVVKAPSTFPNSNAAGAALRKPNFPNIPPGGQAQEFVCNTYCGWGIRANASMSAKEAKQAMEALQRFKPDAATWQLADLQAHGFEFVISKHAKAVHGPVEASLFPVIDHTAREVLVDAAAIQHLQSHTLQEAINPNGLGWKAVSSAAEINTVPAANAGGQEKVLLQRGKNAKMVGKALVFISVMVETAFFVAKFSSAHNKIAHVAEYAANVTLIVGQYFACEAVGTAMAVAGYGSIAIVGATIGVGLVFAAIGVAISMLISWLAGPYGLPEWRSDLFAENALFVQLDGVPAHVFVGHSSDGEPRAPSSSTDDNGKRVGLMAGAPGFRSADQVHHDLAFQGKHYLSGPPGNPAFQGQKHYLSGAPNNPAFQGKQ